MISPTEGQGRIPLALKGTAVHTARDPGVRVEPAHRSAGLGRDPGPRTAHDELLTQTVRLIWPLGPYSRAWGEVLTELGKGSLLDRSG